MPFILQGLCFLLALILKAVGPHPCYDSDDDFLPERVPLLKNSAPPPTYVVGDPVYGSISDAWAIRINEKVTYAFESFPFTTPPYLGPDFFTELHKNLEVLLEYTTRFLILLKCSGKPKAVPNALVTLG